MDQCTDKADQRCPNCGCSLHGASSEHDRPGLTVVSSSPKQDSTSRDLKVSFLEMVVEDNLNSRCYEVVLVGTPRGLTFNVRRAAR